MRLPHLPKLLLQHDASPYDIVDDLVPQLIAAAAAGRLHCCMHPNRLDLAVALGQRLVLVRDLCSGPGGGGSGVEFVTATEAPERVTAVAWLTSAASADECVLVGTSEGYLQLHAGDGSLLHRQELHDKGVANIAVRWSGSGLDPEDASEDVTVGFPDAGVRLPSFDVWAVVRWHLRSRQSRSWWGAGTAHHLSPTKFEYRGAGPRGAAACCGPAPISLYTRLTQRQDPPRLLLFTTGGAPPFASFHVEESATPGLLSLVSSFAKSYLPGRAAKEGSSGSGGGEAVATGNKKRRERIVGIAASPVEVAWDDKRCITALALSPCCRWAACCDSLGRVLLVDVGSTLILRVLKGYRDAQAAWLVAAPGQEAHQEGSAQRAEQYLVVHAPRRGVVELWRPLCGVKLGSLAGAPERGVLLQQPALPVSHQAEAQLGGSRRGDEGSVRSRRGEEGSVRRQFCTNCCWMLDLGSLELRDLTPELLELVPSGGGRAGVQLVRG